MRAFRISFALAIIAATSWLMTHQAQAPSGLKMARSASQERDIKPPPLPAARLMADSGQRTPHFSRR
jgi:hypothetical protein